jgi:hypothetical protein
MRKLLRILSALLVLGGLGFWIATGANTGWTKNSIPKKTIDDVTGIEAITYEKKFVPGIELMGGIIVGAGALAGLSFLFRSRKNPPQPLKES